MSTQAVFTYFLGDLGIHAITMGIVQEAYWSMASALSEADGIDYTDPEEVKVSINISNPLLHSNVILITAFFH